jgi:hypothetical protein
MPPKPAPENISNREYYSVNLLTDNPTSYTGSEPYSTPSPTSSTNIQAEASEESIQKICTQSTESFVQITQEEPLSPTPSEMVMDDELEWRV